MKHTFKMAVKMMMGMMGFRLLATSFSGMRATPYKNSKNATESPSPSAFEPMNSTTIYAMLSTILRAGPYGAAGTCPGNAGQW